jgi:hypothetical protein
MTVKIRGEERQRKEDACLVGHEDECLQLAEPSLAPEEYFQ